MAHDRQRLDMQRVERDLRRRLGEAIPKRRAAAALGVSVTALDTCIERRKLVVLRRPGAARAQVETDSLLDLVEQVAALREAGRRRGVLTEGISLLEQAGCLRASFRPNQSAAELRAEYLRMTPHERLREAAELSLVQTTLAQRA